MAATTSPEFPVTDAIGERPPFGAMELLDSERLAHEQQATLARPRRKASLSAKAL